jgi:histone acetyltransferase MYST1
MLCVVVPLTNRTRNQKRKAEDAHDDEHGEFDPNALREHEEFTKVKNVERIELGRYEMETWYFSPLPPEYKECKVRACDAYVDFFNQLTARRRAPPTVVHVATRMHCRRTRCPALSLT